MVERTKVPSRIIQKIFLQLVLKFGLTSRIYECGVIYYYI